MHLKTTLFLLILLLLGAVLFILGPVHRPSGQHLA